MDSRSVLRNTVAALVAVTVTAGGSGVALAGEWTAPERPQETGWPGWPEWAGWAGQTASAGDTAWTGRPGWTFEAERTADTQRTSDAQQTADAQQIADTQRTAETARTARSVRPVTHVGTWKTRAAAQPPRVRRAPAKVRSKAYAFRLVTRRTWSGQQFQCLDSLWTRESNWNHRAYNHGSGAYGIPQALPGHKMGYAGSDWRFNPQTQIRWGLRYIKGRYGSPCGAWGHFRSHNWY